MEAFLEKEEKAGEKIFPPRQEVFNAFVYCPWENVKVVIIGQDPYHDDRQVGLFVIFITIRPKVCAFQ